MKTSQAGLAFIAQNEGTVLHVYNDSVGNPTIGVGHMLTASEKASGVFAHGITEQQALALLAVDVGTAESWVNKGVTVQITQNMFDALVDFTFNCGGGAFTSSTLLKLLNEDNLAGAAGQFLVWDKPAGILGRRERERTLFLTPDVSVPAVVSPPSPSPPAPPVLPDPVVPDPEPVPVIVPPPVSPWTAFINFFVSIFGGKGA